MFNGMKPSDAAVDSARGRDSPRDVRPGPRLRLPVASLPARGLLGRADRRRVRVADKVDRPNVGVMFNLCHWLRVDKQRNYRPLLQQAMPRLWAVSINGADQFDAKPGWGHYIQPLDRGSFDVGGLLKTLKQLGYKGPIGLQCYGIGGDAREHLARSMAAWRKLNASLKD